MEAGMFKRPEPKPKVERYWKGKAPKVEGAGSDSDSDNDQGEIFTKSAVSVSKFTLNPNGSAGDTAKPAAAAPKSVVLKSGHAIKEVVPLPPAKEISLTEQGPVEVISHRRRKQVDQSSKPSETESAPTLGKRAVAEVETPAPVQPVQSLHDELVEGQEIAADDEQDEEEEVLESDPVYTRGEGASGALTRPLYIRPEFREEQAKLEELERLRKQQEDEKTKASLASRNQQLAVEVQQLANKESQDVANQLGSDSDRGLLNDSTEDEEVSYNKWKLRELRRIKRDREEQEKAFKEKEATERRRMMTDEERAQEDKKIGKYKEEMKSSYRFMQKFYEVGIYHRDDDDPLFKRDYNMAVGEDLFDKSVLPTVKHFRRGEEHKKGKSKYTHLVAEDTTNFDPEWLPFETIREKQLNMTAGYKNSNLFDRPGRKKL